MSDNIERKQLGELVEVLNGYAFKSQEYVASGYQVIRIANVQDGYINNANPKYTNISEKYLDRFILNEGDLLISLTGNVGRVGFVTKENLPAVLNQRVAKIIIKNDSVDARYLYYFLKNDSTRKYLENRSKGIAQKNIGGEDIKDLEVLLPSLAEQKKIVKELDRVSLLIEKRKRTIKLLEQYLDSFFNQLLVQRSDFPQVKLESLTSKITDGVHARPQYVAEGIPFISVTNITKKILDFDNCKYISIEDHKNFSKRCKPELGDILYTKVGATYGRACVVDTNDEFSLYVSVALLKPKQDLVDSKYLKFVLNSQFVKKQADRSVKGAGVPDLHLIEIKNFVVPLPSMSEQLFFNKKVTQIEKLIRKMNVQLNYLDRVFESLISSSFIN